MINLWVIKGDHKLATLHFLKSVFLPLMLAFYWDIPGFLAWIWVLRFDWTVHRGNIWMDTHTLTSVLAEVLWIDGCNSLWQLRKSVVTDDKLSSQCSLVEVLSDAQRSTDWVRWWTEQTPAGAQHCCSRLHGTASHLPAPAKPDLSSSPAQ